MTRWIVMLAFALIAVSARLAFAGSCNSDSDCKGVGRCWHGKCGGCSSDSDCNGHGRCSGQQCGTCYSDSDCKIGECTNGKCGGCGSDSDCKGGRCSSGRCSNWPLSTFGPFELHEDGTVVLAPWAAELAHPTNACSATAPAVQRAPDRAC